ncbi:TetR/AcrR family transcriptional regulator [Ochrobactrum quorumnocens]|uniref:TetR/AcrR family transcriptional regulator n=1 Tax=Ochrobactrum quorumnocens TaxID=271865 RepID=A0A5N1JV32_9HYPH|nr:TetR/AcrR family transcriptional regulator [[Ochrobactrum] quorumnocens]KAA9367088.1 TetR/AcrR family transcriptional regulator [[Ochrobactrum] quorumnocens]
MNTYSTTADDILACAKSLLLKGGYNGFSYADIAEVVLIRKASIHHHFPSKRDLVTALIRRHHTETEAGFAHLEAAIAEPDGQLRAYSHYWRDCIEGGQTPFCVCALLASELPVLPAPLIVEIKAYFKSLSRWLTAVLKRGVADGVFNLQHSPQIEAEAFMAGVHGAMLSARAYGDPTMFSKITEPLLQRLIAR